MEHKLAAGLCRFRGYVGKADTQGKYTSVLGTDSNTQSDVNVNSCSYTHSVCLFPTLHTNRHCPSREFNRSLHILPSPRLVSGVVGYETALAHSGPWNKYDMMGGGRRGFHHSNSPGLKNWQ